MGSTPGGQAELAGGAQLRPPCSGMGGVRGVCTGKAAGEKACWWPVGCQLSSHRRNARARLWCVADTMVLWVLGGLSP